MDWYKKYKEKWQKFVDFNDLTTEEQEYILSIKNIPVDKLKNLTDNKI